MPFLHDLRRRVPPQDIQSRIVVCIHVVAAMATTKARLVLSTFTVNGPAFTASLARVLGRHFAQMPTSFFKFVIQ